MTAEEHLEWTKKRCIAMLDGGEPLDIVLRALASDLLKHEELRSYHPYGISLLMNAPREIIRAWFESLTLTADPANHLAHAKARVIPLLESLPHPGFALLAFGQMLLKHPHWVQGHPCFRRGARLIEEHKLITVEEARAYIESVQVHEEPPEEPFAGAPDEGDDVLMICPRAVRIGLADSGHIFVQMDVGGTTVTYALTDAMVATLVNRIPDLLADRAKDSPEPSSNKRVYTWDA